MPGSLDGAAKRSLSCAIFITISEDDAPLAVRGEHGLDRHDLALEDRRRAAVDGDVVRERDAIGESQAFASLEHDGRHVRLVEVTVDDDPRDPIHR